MVFCVGDHVHVTHCDNDKDNLMMHGYGFIKSINDDNTYDVLFTIDKAIGKSISSSRTAVTVIGNIPSPYKTTSRETRQSYVAEFERKASKPSHIINDYTTSIITSIYSSTSSAFKSFMSEKVKDTKGWLLLEHKKSIDEVNVIEPELTRNKTFSEKAMIVIQYILLSKDKHERYEKNHRKFLSWLEYFKRRL